MTVLVTAKSVESLAALAEKGLAQQIGLTVPKSVVCKHPPFISQQEFALAVIKTDKTVAFVNFHLQGLGKSLYKVVTLHDPALFRNEASYGQTPALPPGTLRGNAHVSNAGRKEFYRKLLSLNAILHTVALAGAKGEQGKEYYRQAFHLSE